VNQIPLALNLGICGDRGGGTSGVVPRILPLNGQATAKTAATVPLRSQRNLSGTSDMDGRSCRRARSQ